MSIKHSHSGDHFSPWLENLILGAIVLVIVHTIVEDLSVIYNWPHSAALGLAIASVFFDLLFSTEFVGRSIISHRNGMFKEYMMHQRGWIDAISSIPLLFLVSGPTILMYILGNTETGASLGFFSILKTAKAIRVARILRLIRIIKLFGKIQNTESVMANRHIGMISTISVVTMILVLVIAQFLPFARLGDHGDYLKTRQSELQVLLESKLTTADKLWLANYFSKSPQSADVIELRDQNNKVIYVNPDKANLIWKAYNGGAFIEISKEYKIILSHHIADSIHAKENMIVFLAILGLIFAMMFIYSRIFAQQITDILFVMNKGFRNWDYNLQAKENKDNLHDEIVEVAQAYNNKWLPIKNQIVNYRRKQHEEKSAIKMDDLFN